ncbi:MAG: DNA polymerase III subunit beta [Verrucomicrobia bacterium]|nr:MAG: DNA polymerase III subunit beta [Verrucomicrobiota bacterium]
MKFKINRDHFVAGLQKVQNIVGNRVDMPILNNVLIKVEPDHICLTTTNINLGIRCHIKTEPNNQVGSITLPVKKLLTIVRALPNLAVDLEASDSYQAKITSGGARFKIMGMSETDFPPLPTIADLEGYVVTQNELLKMLKSVSYAQSTDENRHMLNGVYFSFKEGKLTLVATDGKRLGLATKELPTTQESEKSFILPAKTAAELERLLGQEKNVTISFNNKQAVFDIELDSQNEETGLLSNIYLVSKVVDSIYPNYKQVIPSETVHRVKIDRELLLECLSRAALVTNEKSNSVKLKISNNLLEITASSPELGESQESMAINSENANVELAFNPQFLIDPLKSLYNDEVFFEFKDELSPGLFKTLDSFLCVIMPLRTT